MIYSALYLTHFDCFKATGSTTTSLPRISHSSIAKHADHDIDVAQNDAYFTKNDAKNTGLSMQWLYSGVLPARFFEYFM